jgi:hypothetical protein
MIITDYRTTIRILGFALFLAALSSTVHAQSPAPSNQIPPQLRAPEGAKLLLHAIGKGDQIYTCKKQDAGYAWTLKAPEAQLFDEKGHVIGRHFGGPSWRLSDDSQVTGKVVARADSPENDAIPWLLLTAADHSGTGLMSNVASIQRLNTRGGKAPADGCDPAHDGTESRVSYSADYYFYAKAPGQ